MVIDRYLCASALLFLYSYTLRVDRVELSVVGRVERSVVCLCLDPLTYDAQGSS